MPNVRRRSHSKWSCRHSRHVSAVIGKSLNRLTCWNSFFARTRETDIQNERTRERAAGGARNWGAEVTPSALLLSAHWEEQELLDQAPADRHAIYFGHRRTFRKTDDFVKMVYYGFVPYKQK